MAQFRTIVTLMLYMTLGHLRHFLTRYPADSLEQLSMCYRRNNGCLNDSVEVSTQVISEVIVGVNDKAPIGRFIQLE